MERTVRTQRSLSKQEEIDECNELESYNICRNKSSSSEISNSSKGEDQVHTSPNSPLNNNNNINNNNNNVLHRSRSQSKVKLLVRSHAVREETSPPPDPPLSPQPSTNTNLPNTGGSSVLNGSSGNNCSSVVLSSSCNIVSNINTQQSGTAPALRVRHKLRREGSSQGSTESWEPVLSRANSREQYDGSNTVDLQQFIAETLNRNYKDRILLLKIEGELLNLAKDPKKSIYKFGQMSSYQRMLVHRVAAYFGMEHNVDPSGASVIVNTTKATRIPDRRFKDFVREDLLLPEEPRRSILKRDSSSFDETGCFKSGDRMLNGESRRSKSFEEREEEYEKVRRRIFNREHSTDCEVECMDDLHWEGDGMCSQCEQSGRVQSHSSSIERSVRLLKVESYESSDTLRANSLRLSVSKSHSFNGYDPPQNTRILTKQDSGSSMSSRISPSSSGYKSQRSDATLSATPSPTATPNLHNQTGQPYTNPDGTIYHFDPANPPRVQTDSSIQQHASQQQNKPSDCAENEAPSAPPNSVSSQEKTQPGQQYDTNLQPQPPEPRVCTSLTACVAVGPTPQGYMANTSQTGGNVGSQSGQAGLLGPATNYPTGGGLPPPAMPPPPAPPLPAPYPAHHQYSVLLPPAHHPSAEQPQYHPAPAVVCPAFLPHQYSDPRISGVIGWQEGSPAGGDLTSYMMGLSLDGSRTVPPQGDARPVPPTALYWSHHLQGQNGGQAVPVYYAGGGGQNGSNRYQVAPPQAPSFPHPSQLAPPPPQPSQHPADHAGGCYGPGYTSAGPECIPYAPPTALHMYYSTAPCNNGGQQTSGQTNGYYNGGVSTCGAPLVTLQYQHPTPPHTPHVNISNGVCGQFAVYNGCYPAHYTPPTSALPVAQLFRKPALQVGVRCNSPLRPPYPGSPTMKERGSSDKQPPPPPPLQHSLPVYGIRVVPGDMRLLGNAGRLPFALPVTKATHTRKHRSKGGAASIGNNGTGAVTTNGGTRVAQQQEALATAIEVTGHQQHRHHNNNNNAATAKA